MSLSRRKRSRVWWLLILALLFFFLIGWLLDREGERLLDQLYVRDSQGVIRGLNTVEHKGNHQNALIIIHGFLSSPEAFQATVNSKKLSQVADIYVPRLPYHGKNLQAASQLNNQDLLNFISGYVNNIEKKYPHVTLMGFSYGGALTVALLKQHRLPKKLNIILYAPAIFITSNNVIGRLQISVYSLWRKYCNYHLLGCGFPAYQSGDNSARLYFEKESNLRYVVFPAMKQLFALDRANRDYFSKIPGPFSLLIAKDDNRVSYLKQQRACQQNSNCHFYAFPSGKHFVHLGQQKHRFDDLIVKLVSATARLRK